MDDSLFHTVRGPASHAFEDWLTTNLAAYDVVLAHGAPFAPALVTAELAYRSGVPYVMLPHYHLDDKYYHWQSYYEAFARADTVFAFPDCSKALFFDKIGARAVCIPGGGVDAEEFHDLDSSIRAFQRLHTSPRPFILVLGRKAGGKRYERVIRAVETVRARGHACDLVMIGPDEDSLPITSGAVSYYGSQPRAVVVGALACCTSLATMSESESFGIVLLEAWMCRKPVIANRDCAAFAELVDHEVDGLLCGTDEQLASAIERLLTDQELRDELGAHGHEKAVSRFTWRRIASSVGDRLLSTAR